MRVTPSMYYKNVTAESSRANERLFDVNKQIASGLKIQYASDDIGVFTDTMRLDNELITLKQVTKSTESGYKTSDQTDVVLNEFESSINRMNTLLVQAANGTNDSISLDAIAAELRALEDHFINLSNTSINGQYLFSGSAVDTKPIAADGRYMGNDVSRNAFLGSGIEQQFNLTGSELFLGEEVRVKREITSNVVQTNLSSKYPDFTDATVTGTPVTVVSSDTIRDLMGDTDNAIVPPNNHYFYLRGAQSDGTSFSEKIVMTDTDTIDSLLDQIGDFYGNTASLNVVNVSLNGSGEIVIEDKLKGSSKLDFHMVGATDLSGGVAADVNNIDLLDSGEKDFDKIIFATSTAVNSNLHVKEFVKSPFAPSDDSGVVNIDSLLYDRTEFTKDGSKLSSNVPQILKTTNAFAQPSTKISEVADLSQGTAGTLDGTQFTLSGTNVSGIAYTAQIDFATAGSTFSLDGGLTNYDIFNMQTPRVAVAADDMTYRQLMDVVNMVVTSSFPAAAPGTEAQFDSAIVNSNSNGRTYLSYDGKVQFEDLNSSSTQATISIHDSNSGDFTVGADSSVMSFNANNALTIRDPKTDFFKTLDEIITSVENYKLHPDSSSSDMRSIGIGNSISRLSGLRDHVSKSHAQVGAQSNALTFSLERTQILEITTMSLRSSVIDTDLAEASLKLTQLTNNYSAMLYTVGKVSQLSLVNYL
ncbi:flagellar hook-associated protein FlgL [Candidatus Sulfurimonas marisnigri]|uniref:Flagellar hook-associated protein FlgL n=1 Tax=Candidatus Sulfurimonas marisnigri TaxID=2740405 RepID=A0A7S7LY74_9BACT|nr:flagellar hook-associated protein FlgL [Candidatus Sulfurimonas marisnigri]QOY53626.1 flagellar hook-associated protein FlgL [Candidatus Sulfurimonas marisnigri]